MRRRIAIIMLILIFPAFALAQPKNEAERLWELGDKAYKEKRYQEAISYYQQSLKNAVTITNVTPPTITASGRLMKIWQGMMRLYATTSGPLKRRGNWATESGSPTTLCWPVSYTTADPSITDALFAIWKNHGAFSPNWAIRIVSPSSCTTWEGSLKCRENMTVPSPISKSPVNSIVPREMNNP